jgi:two-component system, response regulator PdtaR
MSFKPAGEGGTAQKALRQPRRQNRANQSSAGRDRDQPAASPARLTCSAAADGSRPLRIIVADADAHARASCREALRALGHDACMAQNGRQLLEQCRLLRPDLVIAELNLPDIDCVAELRQLCAEQALAVMLLSSAENAETLQRAAGNDYVFACLCKPIPHTAWGPAIAVTLHRFRHLQSLMKSLEDRKLVERAKGVVTRLCCLDEGAAYQRMKRLASNHNWKLADVSRMILTSAEVFQSLDQLDPSRTSG